MMKIANAPCSWGVLEFDLEGEAAGVEYLIEGAIAEWAWGEPRAYYAVLLYSFEGDRSQMR